MRALLKFGLSGAGCQGVLRLSKFCRPRIISPGVVFCLYGGGRSPLRSPAPAVGRTCRAGGYKIGTTTWIHVVRVVASRPSPAGQRSSRWSGLPQLVVVEAKRDRRARPPLPRPPPRRPPRRHQAARRCRPPEKGLNPPGGNLFRRRCWHRLRRRSLPAFTATTRRKAVLGVSAGGFLARPPMAGTKRKIGTDP